MFFRLVRLLHRTSGRWSGDGAKVHPEQQPASLLLYEDERRAKLVLDLMPYLPVFIHRAGRLAADHHGSVTVDPDRYLVPFEGSVGKTSGIVPGEPLLFAQHEAAWSYGDEVVRENTTERDRITPELGCGPVLSQPLQQPALILHSTSSEALLRFYTGVYGRTLAAGSEVRRGFRVTNVMAGLGRATLPSPARLPLPARASA